MVSQVKIGELFAPGASVPSANRAGGLAGAEVLPDTSASSVPQALKRAESRSEVSSGSLRFSEIKLLPRLSI